MIQCTFAFHLDRKGQPLLHDRPVLGDRSDCLNVRCVGDSGGVRQAKPLLTEVVSLICSSERKEEEERNERKTT